MNDCTICWLLGKKKSGHPFLCLAVGAHFTSMPVSCKTRITDKDVLQAQREDCWCCTDDCRKCPGSVIFDHDLRDTVAFDSAVEGTETARKETDAIDCFHVKVQRISNTWVISGQSMDGSQFERPATPREVRSLSKLGLINVTAQPGTKAATDEDTDTDKLTCENCSFACKSDVRAFPVGVSSSIPLPGGVFYCPERDTRVPGTLEGCELHSERKKDTEGNLDEVNSLDNTIDECFREMERLINTGAPKNTRPPEQLRKEAVITKRIRAERDALRVCNEKLSKDNKALRDKVSFLKANSKVITRYVELQDKDLEQKYEEFGLAVDKYSSLVDKYSHLTDERNELKEKVNSLEKELKTANLDRVATEQSNSQICMEFDMVNQDLVAHKCLNMDLEAKLARIKKELSGKWRLLEPGEEPQKGDQAFLIDSNNVLIWVEPNGFKGIVKEETVPVRRKITI